MKKALITAETRPWGTYQVLHLGANYLVKRVEVKPGLRLSLQRHFKRAENWIVVEGQGLATVGNQQQPVKRGSVIRVGVEEVHRMQNTGKTPLIFIEVGLGDYLEEDDIERLEDDFNRA